MTDASYSVDRLREEEAERAKLKAARDERIVKELTTIRNILLIIAGLLGALALRS